MLKDLICLLYCIVILVSTIILLVLFIDGLISGDIYDMVWNFCKNLMGVDTDKIIVGMSNC